MKNKVNWDIDKLKIFVKNGLTSEQIGIKFNTSAANIRSKCSKLGIVLGTWTNENLNLLLKCIKNHKHISEIAKILNISRGGVYNKVKKLGLLKECNVNSKEHWTENELLELKKLKESKYTNKEISIKLGKTKESVDSRCQMLKIKSPPKWTEDEDTLLLKFIKEKLSIEEISNKLNKTYRAIYGRITTRGINFDGSIERQNSKNFQTKFGKNPLTNIINRRIKQIRNRSKETNSICDITREYILDLYKKQNGKCYFSGIEMKLISNGHKINDNPYILSIDRINSSNGYTKDNIVLCCLCINIMKNSFETNKFLEICKTVIDYQTELKVLQNS